MDILAIGAKILADKLGGNLDPQLISNALGKLLGNGGELDIAGLVSTFSQSGALSSVVGSWLGDDGNEAVSPQNIMSSLGGDKVGEFADTLGVSQDEAAAGLSSAIPEMIDKASSGGSLLDSVGGASGLMGMASKLF